MVDPSGQGGNEGSAICCSVDHGETRPLVPLGHRYFKHQPAPQGGATRRAIPNKDGPYLHGHEDGPAPASKISTPLDDLNERQEVTYDRNGSFTAVPPEADGITKPSSPLSSSPTRRGNGPIEPAGMSLPTGHNGDHRPISAACSSIYSTSSPYSDLGLDHTSTFEHLLNVNPCIPPRSNSTAHCVTMGREPNIQGEFPVTRRASSRASNSTNDDPFKFDSGPYSKFLHSEADLDVNLVSRHINPHNRLHANGPFSAERPHGGAGQGDTLCGNSSFYHPEAIQST